MKESKKIVIDTKNPLGNPNGIRVVLGATLITSIGVDVQIASQVTNMGNTPMLLVPLSLNIIPFTYPCWKWIDYNIINRKIYKPLMDIVHAEKLIDYADTKEKSVMGQRKVDYGVKIVYEETDKGIFITFYPNGIKNSEAVRTLNHRLEEDIVIPLFIQIKCLVERIFYCKEDYVLLF